MVVMTEIQDKLAELQEKGWTLAALADELGVTVNAVQKWKVRERNPNNSKSVLSLLDQLSKRKRIPKKKRYKKPRNKLK